MCNIFNHIKIPFKLKNVILYISAYFFKIYILYFSDTNLFAILLYLIYL